MPTLLLWTMQTVSISDVAISIAHYCACMLSWMLLWTMQSVSILHFPLYFTYCLLPWMHCEKLQPVSINDVNFPLHFTLYLTCWHGYYYEKFTPQGGVSILQWYCHISSSLHFTCALLPWMVLWTMHFPLHFDYYLTCCHGHYNEQFTRQDVVSIIEWCCIFHCILLLLFFSCYYDYFGQCSLLLLLIWTIQVVSISVMLHFPLNFTMH